MTYELEFKVSALKEWRKLDNSIRGRQNFFKVIRDKEYTHRLSS